MYEHARSFYRAFTLMQGQQWPRNLPDGTVRMAIVGDLISPMIVCGALACELMLKTVLAQHSILAVNAKGGGEHDLRRLVDLLPDHERQLLVGRMGRWAAAFDEQIAVHGQAFVRWRYVYERNSATADDDFLETLFLAARNCAYPNTEPDDFVA